MLLATRTRFRRRAVRRTGGASGMGAAAIAFGLFVSTGCSLVEGSDPAAETASDIAATVGTVAGVGVLPAYVAPADPPSATTPVTGVPLDPSGESGLGKQPQGNRVLLIGDSIFAATSSRLGGEMCAALEPLGWQVAVEAEVSRQVSFGVDVLRARGDEGWDVGVVFLGTNYNGDDDDYLAQLNRIITEFALAPVVLVTASRHSEAMDEVNDIIRGLDDLYPHVTSIDWERVTADDPALLVSDGVHLSTGGRAMLTALIASHLGQAPDPASGAPAQGDCLESVFVDDTLGEMPDLDAPAATSNASSRPTTTVSNAGGSTPGGPTTGGSDTGGSGGDTGSGGSGGGAGDADTGGDDAPMVPDEDPEQELPVDG